MHTLQNWKFGGKNFNQRFYDDDGAVKLCGAGDPDLWVAALPSRSPACNYYALTNNSQAPPKKGWI